MMEFEYIAINSKGQTCTGKISANDLKQAKKKVQQTHLSVLKVKMAGEKSRSSSHSAEKGKAAKALALQKKYSSKGEGIGLEFLKRLLELHGSGMPVADAVKLLNHRLSDPQQRNISGVLWKQLAEGRTLSRAMRQLPGYFSESSTYVIEAGEATGNLAPILHKIVSHLEEKKEIRSKVIGGMTYPIFVCCIALGVVLFFLFFLLPQIQEMLASLDGELNMMAQLMITGSNLVLVFGPFVLIGVMIALGGIYQWSKSEKGGMSVDRSLLRLPLFGNIYYLSELFHLTSLLGTLMWSGIGLTENLRLCERTIKNRYLRASFRAARVLVNEGKSLPDAFRKFKLMPPMQLDVIEVGEKTGNLGNSLEDISKSFRLQLTGKIKTMTTLISGLGLGFAFSLVALVAISIVTSVFQVSKSISF